MVTWWVVEGRREMMGWSRWGERREGWMREEGDRRKK